MLVTELGQHLQVASQEEAVALTGMDKRFWNVISIYGTSSPRPLLRFAASVHHACFDDIEAAPYDGGARPAALDVLEAAFQFADGVGRAPLLIHCRMGLSRSAGVMLGWLHRRIGGGSDAPMKALEILLRVRPRAVPNELVVRLGLQLSMPAAEAAALARMLVNDPRVLANRPQG
ncbi:MAG: hypothetical protein HZA61_09810 [Candidatus Eisenbacteria bacterium]|uniref:Tyrosine specific protein phosphatases domain-containing protein n=1 Tax=Eiseniibacteriota bacterium TaxID=2212470 RepID=A0A933SC30_UNCEI|nr:hypothetical protein [Candidatus Eisenbacteria bacterium]